MHMDNSIIKKAVVNKHISVYFISALILLSYGSFFSGATDDADENKITQIYTINTLEISQIHSDQQFVNLKIAGVDATTGETGGPLLPSIRDSLWLPYGSRVTSVTLFYEHIQDVHLPNEKVVTPTKLAVPLLPPNSLFDITIPDAMNEEIYNSHQSYGEHFAYTIGYGKQMNGDLGVLITYEITPFVFTDVADGEGTQVYGDVSVDITYEKEKSTSLIGGETYDLLILTPSAFVNDLQPLVTHKEEMGLKTKLVTLDEIYDETYFETLTNPRDIQEQIKYFIYRVVLPTGWDVDYVMAVGGWRTFLGLNRPNQQFPVHWIEDDKNFDGSRDEPGYVTDQYYACCVAYEDGIPLFDPWNGAPTDIHSDVYFGRLACRNRKEVRTCVDKIIHYETNTYGSDWFNRFLTITGDGFQDMGGLNHPESAPKKLSYDWDISDLPDGEYTIYAQSELYGDSSVKGPIDEVQITIDRTAESRVTFVEDDHLKIKPLLENQEAIYPALPVAEIIIPSDGDVLGNTEVSYTPEDAYSPKQWATVNYNPTTEVLTIQSKSYDPSPKYDQNKLLIDPENNPYFGLFSNTNISIWVKNNNEEIVEGPIIKGSWLFYEGEMECEKAHDYIPDSFEETRLWTSNGLWTGMQDVIDEISEGYGFVYFAGHGNPMSWGDHLPGIPGGRDDGMINGLKNVNLDFGLARYESEEGDPLFPMDKLINGNQQPVTLIGGCHNSMIDASLSKLLIEPNDVLFTVLHGAWVPECFSWWLARMPQGGAIATIGCSGLGYGYPGPPCVEGLGGWLNPEFFRIYVEYADEGIDTVGAVYTHTLLNFSRGEAPEGGSHGKTIKEWVLLGDPSLKIGGYDMDSLEFGDDDNDLIEIGELVVEGGSVSTTLTNNMGEDIHYVDWELRVDSAAPLARYFGVSGTFVENIFRGRVFNGGFAHDNIGTFTDADTIEISMPSVFGFGHIEVNCSVFYEDELLVYEIEDGFLFGGRLYVFHPED